MEQVEVEVMLVDMVDMVEVQVGIALEILNKVMEMVFLIMAQALKAMVLFAFIITMIHFKIVVLR
jgi:hypothetical protein